MSDSILITGGCGFIGTSLIAKLLEENPQMSIRVLDNFLTGQPEDLASITPYVLTTPEDCVNHTGVTLIEGDIRDEQTARLCCVNISVIVHLAANTGVGPSVEEPRFDMESNIIGTFNMLEAARLAKVEKFIFASSGAPAGEVEPPIHEEVPMHPVSPYGASKLAGEGYCSAYFRTYGIKTVCLRFSNVFGPLSKKKSSIVAKFIRQALAGEVCEIYGNGTQTRDFLYIDDLVRAVILSMKKDVGGETFQIASGREHTVSEITELIADVLAGHGVKMEVTYSSPRLGDVMRNYSDTSKAARMLCWTCEMDLREGVERTVAYFLEKDQS